MELISSTNKRVVKSFPYVRSNYEIPFITKFKNNRNQIFYKILWLKTLNYTVDALVKSLDEFHTVVVYFDDLYIKQHRESFSKDFLTFVSSNVNILLFLCDIFSILDNILLPRDISRIEFNYPLPKPISIPKVTHTVYFESIYCHNLKLSKNILRLRISTSNPLIYPKNIIILSHTHCGSQYSNMSKKLKYLCIPTVRHAQFNLSKNIYHLLISEECLNLIILPKTIKILKLPPVVKHNLILPKHMYYLSIYYKIPNKIIIPEELNELEFVTAMMVRLSYKKIFKNTSICDNIPNGVKCLIKNTSVSVIDGMTNEPNTLTKLIK